MYQHGNLVALTEIQTQTDREQTCADLRPPPRLEPGHGPLGVPQPGARPPEGSGDAADGLPGKAQGALHRLCAHV